MALAVATDLGGVVPSAAIPISPRPVLCDICTAPDVAEDIPAFQARTLSEKERKKCIAHFNKCGPCREILGWGCEF
jgi:hypothetical protein